MKLNIRELNKAVIFISLGGFSAFLYLDFSQYYTEPPVAIIAHKEPLQFYEDPARFSAFNECHITQQNIHNSQLLSCKSQALDKWIGIDLALSKCDLQQTKIIERECQKYWPIKEK